MSLISNLVSNYTYLKQDFTGIYFSPFGILLFLLYCLIPILIILICYLLGEKIQSKFFQKENKITAFFINIVFGLILSASLILVLGMLGVLYLNVLYTYYFLIVILAVFPLTTLKKRLEIFNQVFRKYKEQFFKNKLANTAILLFVLVSFLRLIPPEVGVDAVWYHTDYPRIYLNSHSMITLDPRGKYYPAATPTLSDMLYVFTQSISVKESSRYIHFGFYLLVLLEFLILFKKRYAFIPYAVLLFTTSPIIIRVSSSAYAEFPWVLCWLLAVFLATSKNKHTYRDLLIPAILIGGTLAIKLWLLPFYGVFILYIFFTNFSGNKFKLFKLLIFFSTVALTIPFLWYLRAFIITGNPLFPTFWNYLDGTSNTPLNFSFDIQGLKDRMLSIKNISPLSIIGLIFLLPFAKNIKTSKIIKNPFTVFVIILTLIQLIINYSFHRFVIPFYSIFAITLALGIEKFIDLGKFFKYTFYLSFFILFLYYFLNTLFILPYGLGWADENNYLTRVLSRDNSSYYDFGGKFSKYLTNKDIVATYGLWGFYYANFKYIYTEDYFRKEQRNLAEFNSHGATKLMILGGDLKWLCEKEKLKGCEATRYKLLTNYSLTETNFSMYLYELK